MLAAIRRASSREISEWRLLGDVRFANPKSLCNTVADRSSSVQYHIQVSTINAVVFCKCNLTPLTLDCGLQQTNNIVIVKYKLETAQTAGEGNCMSFVIDLERHLGLPRVLNTNKREDSSTHYRIKGLSGERLWKSRHVVF